MVHANTKPAKMLWPLVRYQTAALTVDGRPYTPPIGSRTHFVVYFVIHFTFSSSGALFATGEGIAT